MAALAVAFVYAAVVMTASLGFWTLMPALALFGVGIGLAITQLTNVVLYDVDPDKSGVASGANTTARQVGFAIGVAIMEGMLNTETVSGTASRIPLGGVAGRGQGARSRRPPFHRRELCPAGGGG